MKKKFLALVLSAFAFGTIGGYAQTESAPCPQEQQCEKEKKCCKGEGKKGKGKKGHAQKGKRVDRQNLFAGLDLTPEQQQQLQALRQERKDKSMAERKAQKEARAQQRKEFDAKLQQILTPEQYQQFKANADKMKEKKGKMRKPLADIGKTKENARKAIEKLKKERPRQEANA